MITGAIGTGCPDEGILEEIAAGGATDADLSVHVMTCERCTRRLSEIEAENELLAECRSAQSGGRRWAPSAGLRLGAYVLGDELGRGGQGVVYQARDERTGRRVAIKMLTQGRMASLHLRRRFEREIEIVAGLRHPGIVTLYEVLETPDGSHAIVMELVEGTPLDRWCAERRAATAGHLPAEVLGVLIEVCDAVEYAHLRGVIHRDLKPSNILVDRDGRPRVLDFGIAKLETAEDEQTLTTGFIGSPAFAAPEQILGEGDRVDLRADLFALGAVSYHALCGVVPFPGRGKVTELASVVRDEPLPDAPSRHCSVASRMVRRDLDAVLRKALAAEPGRRYRSVAEFRDDLAALRDGDPVDARPDALSYLVRRALRRHRVAVAATIGVAGVLISTTTAAAALWKNEANRSRYELSLGAVVSLMGAVTPDANVRTTGALSDTERHRIRANMRAYEELIEGTSGDPVRQAEYCHGWAHLLSSGLGDHGGALPHALKAVSLRRDIGGSDVSVIESLELVAYITLRLGRYDDARTTVGLMSEAINAAEVTDDRRATWSERVRLLDGVIDSASQAREALPHVKDAAEALDANDHATLRDALEKALKALPEESESVAR